MDRPTNAYINPVATALLTVGIMTTPLAGVGFILILAAIIVQVRYRSGISDARECREHQEAIREGRRRAAAEEKRRRAYEAAGRYFQ